MPSLFRRIRRQLNFFRIHVIVFVVTPLVCAGIFFGSNGEFPVSFIDALFLCYSAMTVTGLTTVNLSQLTGFQQSMLWVLMLAGDVTSVSLVMILLRKHYFKSKCAYLSPKRRSHRSTAELFRTVSRDISQMISPPTGGFFMNRDVIDEKPETKEGSSFGSKVAVEEPTPKPTKDDGFQKPGSEQNRGVIQDEASFTSSPRNVPLPLHDENPDSDHTDGRTLRNPRNAAMQDAASFTSSPRNVPLPLHDDIPTPGSKHTAGRAHFDTAPVPLHSRDKPSMRRRVGTLPRVATATGTFPRSATILNSNLTQYAYTREVPARRAAGEPYTNDSGPPYDHLPSKERGFGFFPTPLDLIHDLIRRFSPRTYRKLHRGMTIPYTQNIQPSADQSYNSRRWLKIKGQLVITRNGDFHTDTLTREDLEELGGVEYRALRLLGWAVALYFILTQLIPFIAIASWLSRSGTYDGVFSDTTSGGTQFRVVPKPWFAAFNVVGAYTGGGMSLVDLGMVPFQKAYLMIILLMFAILAGNHALPIFLRFSIWVTTKFVQRGGRMDESLHFLLDHPRRCYIYMFPSEVTWFLVAVLIFLSSIELFAFCVLDTGLPVTDSLPLGQRVIDGLFQSFAVRASGFAIVNISALAPAVQFLYVIMMYIAVFPVALSIRSTNVYEERSLGVFEEPPEVSGEEPTLPPTQPRRDRIGKYLSWHVRRQLSVDLWWLVVAIWLICIIERDMLMDDENAPWFNIFRVVFELVSAFGTIGLSLGFPAGNYSFSGALRPLSKIVVIIIMVRGRHRGLPVAIDRAVLLPSEYKEKNVVLKEGETIETRPATELVEEA